MKHLKLTFVGLLALTSAASDAFAFGPPGPPIGGPPMGGGLPRPPMGGGLPAPPMGGGVPRPSLGGKIVAPGPAGNLSGNVAAGPSNSGNVNAAPQHLELRQCQCLWQRRIWWRILW